MKYFAPIGLAFFLVAGSAFCQNPPPVPEKPPIKITGIKTETASLPGSSLAWTKIVIGFSSADKWADGIVFAVQAVLADQAQFRLIAGGVRYANIPAGNHNAVLYISPRATARFGKPVLIQATCLFKDSEVGAETWQDPAASPPSEWASLNRYPGVLVNVLSTPWIMLDFEKSPDVIGAQ